MTKNENPANVLEYKPIEMFCYLLKAEVYKDNWSAQNLKQLERKIRALAKNTTLTFWLRFLEGSGQRSGTLGVIEQLKPDK